MLISTFIEIVEPLARRYRSYGQSRSGWEMGRAASRTRAMGHRPPGGRGTSASRVPRQQTLCFHARWRGPLCGLAS